MVGRRTVQESRVHQANGPCRSSDGFRTGDAIVLDRLLDGTCEFIIVPE